MCGPDRSKGRGGGRMMQWRECVTVAEACESQTGARGDMIVYVNNLLFSIMYFFHKTNLS
jgi:hypothetical protein